MTYVTDTLNTLLNSPAALLVQPFLTLNRLHYKTITDRLVAMARELLDMGTRA